ncbi:MAG TPA: hypothetical protein VGO60_17460, partial [Iamia sp.]|nr:hypothetical protein [Iamia sp.]
FIGQLSGAYSSIFIASPLLALLKEREPRYRALRERLADKASRTGGAAEVAPMAAAGDGVALAKEPVTAAQATTVARPKGTPPPRPRKKGKKR